MGGVRTALFNYLFAKKHGGDFLLRIEDTDQTRYVPGAEEYIQEALKWCGLIVDEGVGAGGDCGPYRQSERKPLYKQYALQLVESGNAYHSAAHFHFQLFILNRIHLLWIVHTVKQ